MTSKTTPPARIPTITVGLRPFPGVVATVEEGSTPPAVRMLLATLHAQPNGGARFVFDVDADLARLRIPAASESGSADELWRHTCFEVFLAAPGSDAYHEFNFSPSGQWAHYAFGAYRERDAQFSPAVAPRLHCSLRADGFTLEAELTAASLPARADSADFRVGLCAVIELANGELEYWALHHGADKPDFHDRNGFVLALSPTVPEAE
ncbi:DOMON-like domain-containing protein [Azoarcus sp. L1K30]|uniref:DOMON-like domain-containing protein n=1 Tax=Azoarcus sp. L1K30 TaxID=2820277 RepID=UPI002012E765|nr:DOMON-like domain-containing protein [Azoarcus sp. L1K30]